MQDDGAAIGAFVDEVDGAAADFDAVGEDVAVGVGAGEARQEGRVDVHDAASVVAHEVRGQDAHEAGEDDEGDACFVEGFDEGLFERLAAVELLAVDADGFDAGFFGAREGVGVGLVGQDKGYCRIYFTAADGVDDGLEVGAAAGAQHA